MTNNFLVGTAVETVRVGTVIPSPNPDSDSDWVWVRWEDGRITSHDPYLLRRVDGSGLRDEVGELMRARPEHLDVDRKRGLHEFRRDVGT